MVPAIARVAALNACGCATEADRKAREREDLSGFMMSSGAASAVEGRRGLGYIEKRE